MSCDACSPARHGTIGELEQQRPPVRTQEESVNRGLQLHPRGHWGHLLCLHGEVPERHVQSFIQDRGPWAASERQSRTAVKLVLPGTLAQTLFGRRPFRSAVRGPRIGRRGRDLTDAPIEVDGDYGRTARVV